MASVNHDVSYQGWAEHNAKERTETGMAVLQFLRQAYPDHHVTRTNASKCDLMGFAAAGLAKAVAETDGGHDATRTFKPPRTRLERSAGELVDHVKFGRYRYTFGQDGYIVYAVTYINRYMQNVNLLYVLSPYSHELVKDGHHETTDKLLLPVGQWTKELHEEIYVFDNASWNKDKDLFRSVQDASWDDVILDPATKAGVIQDIQSFFNNQALYKSLKVPWKRGVIFHGVPGNGKTISIKAIINSLAAREDPVPSLYVKSFDSCNGPKWSIRSIFSHARVMAPCLLIFEDLDSLVQPKTRSYFLNEVDGLESNDGILMIGSTNHLDRLDASITKRPSRFDRKYHFKVPNEQERVAYCQFWQAKFSNSPTVDFPDELCDYIAKITDGFSFAYLKELFVASLLKLAVGGQDGHEEPEPAPDATSSESGSNTDGVVVERPASAADGADNAARSEGAKANEGAKETTKPTKSKKVMPEVEVPASLQKTPLLGIVKMQARTLIEQMDNSLEGDEAKKEPSDPCSMRAAPLFDFGLGDEC